MSCDVMCPSGKAANCIVKNARTPSTPGGSPAGGVWSTKSRLNRVKAVSKFLELISSSNFRIRALFCSVDMLKFSFYLSLFSLKEKVSRCHEQGSRLGWEARP